MKNTTLSGTSLPKRKLFADIFSSLLLIFFVHTGISTYVNISSLESLLGVFYTRHATEIAWIIIVTEFLIAIFLFIPKTRIAALTLTILFALTAIVTIIRTPHFPHDFGGVANDISHGQRLLLYAVITILAIIGITISIERKAEIKVTEPNPVVFT